MFPLLANRYSKSTLDAKIKYKGRDEQELQYLFPSLYGNKAVTKRTKALFQNFDTKIFYRR